MTHVLPLLIPAVDHARLDDWRTVTSALDAVHTQIPSQLLDGRIAWTPRRDEGLYAFSGRVKFDGLLNGLVVTQGVTSPTGFEPVFWP